MLLVRRIHAYLGLFIAPSVLFFALSGGLQIFNLHEAHGRYRPPAPIVALGSVHKDQVLSKPDEHHGPPSGAPASGEPAPNHDDDDDHDKGPKASTLVLKWFFEAIAAGLALSTLLGLWIGLRFTRTPRLSWSCFVAGIVLPLLILLT